MGKKKEQDSGSQSIPSTEETPVPDEQSITVGIEAAGLDAAADALDRPAAGQEPPSAAPPEKDSGVTGSNGDPDLVELLAPADTTAIGTSGRSYEVVDGKVMAKPEDVEVLISHGCRQER